MKLLCIHHMAAGKHDTDDVNLTVTCSGSSALVSWSAPDSGSVVNLQYHCFWAKNNTQVSFANQVEFMHVMQPSRSNAVLLLYRSQNFL